MVNTYVMSLAKQMGIKLSKIVKVDGKEVDCTDAHLLELYAKGHNIAALAYQSDLERLEEGIQCDRLDSRVRTSLERLQVVIQP